MRKLVFGNGGYYHVYCRGVDKRHVFNDDYDHRRFLESLYLFNDAKYTNPGNKPWHNESLLAGSAVFNEDRDQFVSIVSYCLMPNHYHLMLRQRKDDGIAKFMHKLGLGYAKYFNKRYERTGRLFESTYKAVAVEKPSHFLHLPRYIHCNALDLTSHDWRGGKIKTWKVAKRELDAYPWSSHGRYLGREQDLPIIDDEEVTNIFSSKAAYEEFLLDWVSRGVPGDLVTADVT